MSEFERINEIYKQRDLAGLRSFYKWDESSAEYQTAIKRRLLVSALKRYVSSNSLADKTAVDIGCGTGGLIRQLCEWGLDPENAVGTEFLEDRLTEARRLSPPGVKWHLGGVDFDNKKYDLIFAQTVFSSILDYDERRVLATDMLNKLNDGGAIIVFDFRYNNPSNSNVKKVSKRELIEYWGAKNIFYKTGMLAPPISRSFVGSNYLLAELLTTLLPFLRTHFIFMVTK